MSISIRLATIADYDGLFELWNSTEQSRRALNPVDDSREGIERYLKRNPTTCFVATSKDGSGDADEIVGVILTGHDGRRAIIHHMCVHPSYRRKGIEQVVNHQVFYVFMFKRKGKQNYLLVLETFLF